MKFSTTTAILAAALGVAAHPSGHGHQHVHRSIEERAGNFVMNQRPAPISSAEPTSTPPPPPPPSTTEAAPPPPSSSEAAPTPTPDDGGDDNSGGNGGSGQGVSTYTEFCSGASKRATLDQIMYAGNTGNGEYGCNMMLAQSNVAEEYKYRVTLTNESDEEQYCACFLKVGPDGGINGFWGSNAPLKFNIPANGVQDVVADENTQGGCTCGSGSLPLTSIGQLAGTWLEFDFGNESNGGWSGADASCLVAAAAGIDIPGMNVCGHGTCSTIYPGGTGENAFLGGMEALDGLGLNLPAGDVHLEVAVAYSG